MRSVTTTTISSVSMLRTIGFHCFDVNSNPLFYRASLHKDMAKRILPALERLVVARFSSANISPPLVMLALAAHEPVKMVIDLVIQLWCPLKALILRASGIQFCKAVNMRVVSF